MKVIGYARISTEEQSNFSIDNQIEAIEDYCNKNNWELVDIFIDDGQSAKSFDRISWRKLETYLAKSYQEIDYLVVYKFDRFSRNLPEALDVINKLEQKQQIRVMSICEPIALPPTSPFYFQLRTQLLLHAHVEREIIRERTMSGIQKAKRSGRFLGIAPLGYKNGRDERNKPILTVDVDKSEVVLNMFKMAQNGFSEADIKRFAASKGVRIRQKGGVKRIIGNVVYCGKVYINSKVKSDIQYFPGIHEPLITQELFDKANAVLYTKESNRRDTNDECYLKGILRCDYCNNFLTVGNSKGRSKYYWYYVCSHCKKNYNVDKAHKIFDSILQSFKINLSAISDVIRLVDQHLAKHLGKDKVGGINLKINNLNEKMLSLEEKFIENIVDKDFYIRYSRKYEEEMKLLKTEFVQEKNRMANINDTKGKIFKKLNNIYETFKSATTDGKFILLKSWFDKNFAFNGEIYRTIFLTPIFDINNLNVNYLDISNSDNNMSIFEANASGCPEQESNLHSLLKTRF